MTVYCTIREAAVRSGISQYQWRKMVHAGMVPFIMCGTKYMVNFPAAMALLEQKSAAENKGGLDQ